jgi:hypothetical protein
MILAEMTLPKSSQGYVGSIVVEVDESMMSKMLKVTFVLLIMFFSSWS